MKIIIAPDKFKDSMNSFEFCGIVEEGLLAGCPGIDIIKLPMADGGDGTMEVIDHYIGGEQLKVEVQNPLFKKIEASYLFSSVSKTAFIEMAAASGLKLLKPQERNCMYTSSMGTGELILDAIKRGAKEILLGIGGSATNDCGIGMASAFGYRFLDKKGNEVLPIGKHLSKICMIDDSNVTSLMENVVFRVACDVTNPLYGKNGAAYSYGAQKGANMEEIKVLDKGLWDFSKTLDTHFNTTVQSIKGAGAAGGMGAGAATFLKGELISGIELILDLANFDKYVKNADWVITGEGLLDHQTLSGKTILGVLKRANTYQAPVAVFCGGVTINEKTQNELGITYVTSILRNVSNLNEALSVSKENLFFTAFNFSKLISLKRKRTK
ncbi:glycerate kinase [Leptobacterium sp. I13]|uniref:glycerate kinase n=1 Tax=Leptobacterium meishanense TaxID=3128904 RepID=UPI0030EEFB43